MKKKLTNKELVKIAKKYLSATSKGGSNTLKRYGTKHFSDMGKKGKRRRKNLPNLQEASVEGQQEVL